MSKSLGNHIGITEAPEEMYGRTLSIPDELIAQWSSLLAIDLPAGDHGPRDLKRALARGIVERFHGAEAARDAEAHFDRVFVERQAPEEIEEAVVRPDGAPTVHLPAVISEAFGRSRSDARRLLTQGGVKLDGEVLGPEDLDIEPGRLDGAVIQVGKRHFRRLRLG
jgi:tyrosyl-tRNA synthetase